MRRLTLVAGTVVAALFVLFVVARLSGILGIHYAAGLSPPAGLSFGQRFISLGCCVTISEGDLIVYREGGRDYVRRVSEITAEQRFVVEHSKGNFRSVLGNDVVGKVVFGVSNNP